MGTHTVELTETVLDTALKHHQFGVARFLLTGKDESNNVAQLSAGPHGRTQIQAFQFQVIHVMDHVGPLPQNPSMAESLRQEALCRGTGILVLHPLMHTLLLDAAHYVSACEATCALVQELIDRRF
jgi:hypothetical protein